ncbi:hypothetical protein HYALB_00004038 [Hymenoscyphus albidus]|uniref:Uncharacterized protein n=1 Tax=Hymenoscyphus albidus TaxID=595503 RepID=A0A9N9LXP4_9HELO|nr:hypothetical protein HYALB_00004038 [Hymenoscyphus albidus]
MNNWLNHAAARRATRHAADLNLLAVLQAPQSAQQPAQPPAMARVEQISSDEYARREASLVYPFRIQADGTPENILVFVYSHHLSVTEFKSQYPSAKCFGFAWLGYWQFHINQVGEPNLRPIPYRPEWWTGALGYVYWMSREEEQRYQASFRGAPRKRRMQFVTVRHSPIVKPGGVRPQVPFYCSVWRAILYWDSDNIEHSSLESFTFGKYETKLWSQGWNELKQFYAWKGWNVEDGTPLDLTEDVKRMIRNSLYGGQRPGHPIPPPPKLVPEVTALAAQPIPVNEPGAPLLAMSMIQGRPDRPWGYKNPIDDKPKDDEPNRVNPRVVNPGGVNQRSANPRVADPQAIHAQIAHPRAINAQIAIPRANPQAVEPGTVNPGPIKRGRGRPRKYSQKK